MTIEIELFGQLSTGRQRRQILTLENPIPIRETVILLGLDPNDVGLMTINGVQSELEDLVPIDCRLCFFPPMSGG